MKVPPCLFVSPQWNITRNTLHNYVHVQIHSSFSVARKVSTVGTNLSQFKAPPQWLSGSNFFAIRIDLISLGKTFRTNIAKLVQLWKTHRKGNLTQIMSSNFLRASWDFLVCSLKYTNHRHKYFETHTKMNVWNMCLIRC